MKKILMIILFSVFFVGCSINTVSGSVISFDDESSIGTIAKYISPAVVGISGISGSSSSVGSGVSVSGNGYVLTNSHVVHGCEDIILYLHDKSQTTAKIIYEDTVLDLAILKCNKDLPYLLLGDSDKMSVGDDILAVGTPLSLNLIHTFTKGIVSAVDRTIKTGSNNGEGYMQNLIQHDASLNPGNSGGPLINSKGEVIGINTLKISSGEGIGFAIPTKSFSSLLSNYIKDENYSVPKLGVYGVDSEIAKFNRKTNLDKGFYVISVAQGSAIKDAGLQGGEVITKINSAVINDTLDLKDELYKHKTSDKIEIEFFKDGNFYTKKIRLK
ncbi:MAG: serine protease [Clostridiales bacterium]|nr:serine protease [Clostridiales bacterium]